MISNNNIINNISERDLNQSFELCFNDFKIRDLFHKNSYAINAFNKFLVEKIQKLPEKLQHIINYLAKTNCDLSLYSAGIFRDLFKYVNNSSDDHNPLKSIVFMNSKERYCLEEMLDNYCNEVILDRKFSTTRTNQNLSELLLIRMGNISVHEASLINYDHLMEFDRCYRKHELSFKVKSFFYILD